MALLSEAWGAFDFETLRCEEDTFGAMDLERCFLGVLIAKWSGRRTVKNSIFKAEKDLDDI